MEQVQQPGFWIRESDLDHSDLNVDNGNSASFVADELADDMHGHGSHVAGIVGALDNARDVVGVAAGATLVAVKVCDQGGGCFVSDVKAGVDYVAGNFTSGDVVNLSLGFPTDDPDHPSIDIPLTDLENSITNAANSGLRFTIAAGNEAQNSNNKSPARINHSNVWTVSAFREGDEFVQTFDWNTPNCNGLQDPDLGSNFENPPVDFSGPGESVLSLWKNGGTLITCGTSMAAPHVAGLLLTVPDNLGTDGFVSSDPDGSPDPIAAYRLTTPSLSGTVVDDGASLSWNAIEGADYYKLIRDSVHPDVSDATFTTSNTSYLDGPPVVLEKVNSLLEAEITYRVKAINSTTESNLSNYVGYKEKDDGGGVFIQTLKQ